jgi:hypothetical protein
MFADAMAEDMSGVASWTDDEIDKQVTEGTRPMVVLARAISEPDPELDLKDLLQYDMGKMWLIDNDSRRAAISFLAERGNQRTREGSVNVILISKDFSGDVGIFGDVLSRHHSIATMRQIRGPGPFPLGTYARLGPVFVTIDNSYSRREASELAKEVSAVPIMNRKNVAIVNFPGGPRIDTPEDVRGYNILYGFDRELLESIVDDVIVGANDVNF